MKYLKSEYIKNIPLFKESVYAKIFKKLMPLKMESWITKEPVTYENRKTGEYKKLEKGDTWGVLWDCAWFHFTTDIPWEYAEEDLVLLIDISGELCIFDQDACPVRGLTNGSSTFDEGLGSPGKRVVFVEKDSNKVDIWADCGCNDLFGEYKDDAKIIDADLAVINREMRQLYFDIEVLYELLTILPENTARFNKILRSLTMAFRQMKNFDTQETASARAILKPELDKVTGGHSLEISAIGHAHIDLAWLWPIRETKRKAARSFSTVLKNMEIYEDYIFGASQPQLYEWIKTDYPALYEKIKGRIKEGRWEVQGGMWVEPDTNLPGGESLVRQILYGKRYYKEEFDVDVETLWLPDVFGYCAALPQILVKSGIKYFMTIKLSWNTINQFPHHTFLWEGLDGSKILAHMPPEGTYNSPASPASVHKTEVNYLDSAVSDHALLLFGIGDGGGGPGEEHLERLKREKNLNGLSPVIQEPSIDFFKKLEKNRSQYQTWVGELYLEKHQGTYTSQSKSKKYNRYMENKLAETELAYVIAYIENHYPYPREELSVIWKEVLLYQFHDLLPGSSIKRVYDESLARYKVLMKEVNGLRDLAFASLTCNKDYYLFNSLSWEVVNYSKIEDKWYKTIVPPLSITKVDSRECTDHKLSWHENIMENNLIKVSFDKDGSIQSIYDKEYGKEVLCDNSNRLTIYDEIGGDNWDFTPLYKEWGGEIPVLKTEDTIVDGPYIIRHQTYRYQNSTIEQDIVLSSESKRIDFKTKLDWQEKKKMLRTSFAVNVHTDHVNCNIQFGNIKRSNNNNTSWDRSKYEICAHKYVDLSQSDYGAALLNDCKYGHNVKGNVIDLNLIRNNFRPDELADLGTHEFTYGFYPHMNDFHDSEVIQESYILNRSPVLYRGLKQIPSLITLNNEKIIIESIKMAEDSDSCIIRLYEAFGGQNKCRLTFSFNYGDIYICDLMETELQKYEPYHDLTFQPYEIMTLKVYITEKRRYDL